MTLIYLDHNATTPLDPLVRAEMNESLAVFGNPSSLHQAGRAARELIEQARDRVASLLSARADEIIFTSGGTESNNLAILGAAAEARRRRLVVSSIEHPAVLNPCRALVSQGFLTSFLPVDAEGVVQLDAAEEAIGFDVALVSLMLANHEIGSIQPLREIVELARRGALVHTDAVQAAGKIKIDVDALGIDLLSISAHKLNGPKGIGALYVRRGVRIAPISFGGQQERGLRPGTENTAAIVGFGKACELARERLDADAARIATLRDRFEAGILEAVPFAQVNGSGGPRLANTSNITFDGVDGETLVVVLDELGVAVSTGAACATSGEEPSHVLKAMGRTDRQARCGIRVSLGRTNTEPPFEQAADEIDLAVAAIARAVESLQSETRAWIL